MTSTCVCVCVCVYVCVEKFGPGDESSRVLGEMGDEWSFRTGTKTGGVGGLAVKIERCLLDVRAAQSGWLAGWLAG